MRWLIPGILGIALLTACGVSVEKATELSVQAAESAKTGDLKTTRSLLEKASASHPEMSSISVELIGVYILDGEIKKAREVLERSVKVLGETSDLAQWRDILSGYEEAKK